ncbi:hypothetical protein OPIT5_20155 [Opitutaceae bacterium TAV5]|nr:hypothetical protein OPIT5_20155 [Opitutaceae bacterium TAV5]
MPGFYYAGIPEASDFYTKRAKNLGRLCRNRRDRKYGHEKHEKTLRA